MCRKRNFIPKPQRDHYLFKNIYWVPSVLGPEAKVMNKRGKVFGFIKRKMPNPGS